MLKFSAQLDKLPECVSKKNTLTRCHGRSDRLTRWTLTFYSVVRSNFRVHIISAYLGNARATRLKIKIEPSFYVGLFKNAYSHACTNSAPLEKIYHNNITLSTES